MEIFVIYNKLTGYIDGGAGRVNRERDRNISDGSSTSNGIARILAKDPDRAVVYLPKQALPDPEKYKMKDGKIVDLSGGDQATREAAKPKSEVELLKERIKVLEDAQIR